MFHVKHFRKGDKMYRALESFTTGIYNVQRNQLLEDDFTTEDEIQDLLEVGYIEVDDGAIKITQNGQYNVQPYDYAKVNVEGSSEEVNSLIDQINGVVI